MKKTIVMMSAFVAAALTACNENDNVCIGNDDPVRFTAAIGNQAVATLQTAPPSRAAGSEWGADDAIGIFMVSHTDNTVVVGEAKNRQFTTTGNGNFTPVTGQEIYYPMNDSPVDFIAYYPYTDGAVLNGTLPVNVAGTQTTATQAAIDMLWAVADNGGSGYKKSSAAAPVQLTFGHCLSKLTMNCRLDPNVGSVDPAAITVTIKGMRTSADFNVKDGKVGTAATSANIIARKLDKTPADYIAAYDAIILPAAYNAGMVTVEFQIGKEVFIWDVEDITFEPGKESIYEVLITRTGVKAMGTITDWVTEEKGPVTAE